MCLPRPNVAYNESIYSTYKITFEPHLQRFLYQQTGRICLSFRLTIEAIRFLQDRFVC